MTSRDELDDQRPVFTFEPGNLSSVVEALERTLVDIGATLYRHAGRLVIPHTKTSVSGQVQTSLQPLALQSVRAFVASYVRLQKHNARQRKMVNIDLPEHLAKLLLERATRGTLLEVEAVLNAPTLRPDGSILCQLGYDPATRLYVAHVPRMEPIPERPTREDAVSAILILKEELLSEIPFASGEDEAVALSLLIASVCCGAMPRVPIHAISASAPGTGKTYLAQLASLIARGEEAPVIAATNDPEEQRKQISSALFSGERYQLLDNIDHPVESALLCQACELSQLKLRPFGELREVTVNGGGLFVLTGNNLSLVGDLTRRALLCRLNRSEARPELHRYAHNPKATVLRDRGRYIRAALIVMRAYIVAGSPDLLAPIASFDEWNKLRSALVWSGEADPADTMTALRALDCPLSDFEVFITAWYRLGPQRREAKARDLIAMAHDDDSLREALEAIAGERGGHLNARRLGRCLQHMRGRVFELAANDGSLVLVLLRSRIGHGNTQIWDLSEIR